MVYFRKQAAFMLLLTISKKNLDGGGADAGAILTANFIGGDYMQEEENQ